MLEEHHALLASAIEELIEREVRPLAAETDEADRLPETALAALAEAGHLGSVLPEPYGSGADILSYVLTVERLAAASPALAWAVVVHVSAAAGIAGSAGDDEHSALLRSLASGERLASFAFTEANAGADFSAIECRAQAADGGYRLTGAKTFISLARRADVFLTLVLAERDGAGAGPTMLLVDRAADGFAAGSPLQGMGMRGIGWGELVFDGCAVPAASLVGEEGKGTRVVYAMARPYLLGAAALGVGIAGGTVELVRAQLREREVKGHPLGDHEALQHRLADLSARVEAARSLAYRSCLDDDWRSPLPFQAKLFASETALDVTRAAMQIGGATAYEHGSAIERMTRDAFALTLHFENNDLLRGFLGRTLLQG